MRETLEKVQVESRKVVDGYVKVYFAFISLLLTILLNQKAQIAAIIIFSALSLHAAGKHYLRLLKVPLSFLIAGIAVILVTINGKPVLELWIFQITDKSLNTAISVLLRSFASLSVLFYLIITTSIPELVSALKKLKLPDFAVEMLLLVYRAVQTLFDEAGRFDRAASSRLGYASFKSFLKTTSMLAYTLFIKSLSRAEKLNVAMAARCYAGEFPVLEVENRGLSFAIAVMLTIIFLGWA
ncbi:cobalt ECF transporter T component CbiQ [Archaeoglobales archaeon]|nr:MAG: cobalt ECF transporter T component CbiQ [Archaeoglobales archaeon]